MHLVAFVVAAYYCLAVAYAHHYHEKTRFDRSIKNEIDNVTSEYLLKFKKPRIFSDFQTHTKAYKLEKDKLCYLEILANYDKYLIAAGYLTKTEPWIIAGDRIINFCKGMKIILIQKIRPVLKYNRNYYYNEFLNDDKEISWKRTDKKKNARIIRTTQEIFHDKIHTRHFHKKRQTLPLGAFHGQTQSHYVNFGTNSQSEGKAEAQATQQSSRAVVTSGSGGMGQAQSISSGSGTCNDCSKYNNLDMNSSGINSVMPIINNTRSETAMHPINIQSEIIPSTFKILNSRLPSEINREDFMIKSQNRTLNIKNKESQFQAKTPNKEVVKDTDTKTTSNIYPSYSSSYLPNQKISNYGSQKYDETSLEQNIHKPNVSVTEVGRMNILGIPPIIQVISDQNLDVQTSKKIIYPLQAIILGIQIPDRNIYLKDNEKIEKILQDIKTSSENLHPFNTKSTGQNPRQSRIQSQENNTLSSQIQENNEYQHNPQNLENTANRNFAPHPLDMNIHSTKTQMPKDHALYTQTINQNTYSPRTHIFLNDTQKHRILEETICRPDSENVEKNTRKNKILEETSFSQFAKAMHDDARKSPLLENNTYLFNTQTVKDSTSVTQIPQLSLYSSQNPLATANVSETQLPGKIVYLSNTKTKPNNDASNQIRDQINRLSNVEIGGGKHFYLPGSHIITEDSSLVKIPQTFLYAPNINSININKTLKNILLEKPVFLSNAHFIDSGKSDSSVLYPIKTQIKGNNTLRFQRPEENPNFQSNKVVQTDIPWIPKLQENVYLPSPQIISNQNSRVSNLDQKLYLPETQPKGISGSEILKEKAFLMNTQNIEDPISKADTSEENIYLLDKPLTGGIPLENKYHFVKIHPSGSYTQSSINSNNNSGNQKINAPQLQILDEVNTLTGLQKFSNMTISVRNRTDSILGSKLDIPINSETLKTEKQEILKSVPMNVYTSDIDNESDSQAISSVKQGKTGTIASAIAQGKRGNGRAKSQVSGIYTGNGSFSAQAGTSDDTKNAQTQVRGGNEGAQSSAQSNSGLGKSETHVQLNPNSGATSSNAQTSGWNHGSNSQVEINRKGGIADAQAIGEGQTSSQAQIGFQPYINQNKNLEEEFETSIESGGIASAQSSIFRGQSQSQLQGSFHSSISYSGAAQSSSGSGSEPLQKSFNITNSDLNLFKPFELEDTKKIEKATVVAPQEQLQTSGTKSKQTVISITSNKYPKNKQRLEQLQLYDFDNAEDIYEEYEDEHFENSQPMQPTIEFDDNKQKMRLLLNKNRKHDKNENILSTGYMAFRDKKNMTSIFSRKITQKNTTAQSKITTITENVTAISKSFPNATFPNFNRVGGIYYRSLTNSKTQKESVLPKTNFFTISNDVVDKIKVQNLTKKYEHRYYTNSTNCGYFTFSCNIVYGSNGRRKICKPKMTTYTDETSKC